MSKSTGSAPPVLLRIRNSKTEVAYILFLSLDRTDLLTSLLSPPISPASPTSPRSHNQSQSLDISCRPRNLDLSGIRVEEMTIEIGSCPINSPEVRHIAYHRGKALALLGGQRWFSHPENSRHQLYAEHYYSRDCVELIEYQVQAYRRASRQSVGMGKNPASHSVNGREVDDEEQRTAAIVAAITANILRQTDGEDDDEYETDIESEAETGSQTLAGSLRERFNDGGQARQRSPSLTVRTPWAHRMANGLAEAALQTVELERSHPSTTSGTERRRPRRATTSARTPITAPQSPVPPKPHRRFWKRLHRQPDSIPPSEPAPNIPRRASTSAEKNPKARNQAHQMYPEGIWENPRPAPKPPVPWKDKHQSSRPGLARRDSSQETMNSFAFVLKAAQSPNPS
ncbi:hypothetical protein MMC30_005874 [Trapelia coarctata]|nr:hypothetical protein [Trapelia coarctata]